MDIFLYKYEKKLSAGQWYSKYESFSSALSLIYLDTVKDMLKQLFIDLSIQNILIPYVYLLYCNKIEETFKDDYESS